MDRAQLIDTYKSFVKDGLVKCISIGVLVFSILSVMYINTIFGMIALLSFIFGCIFPLILIKNRDIVEKCFQRCKIILGFTNDNDVNKEHCGICDSKQCQRHKSSSHNTSLPQQPWKDLLIDENLDKAVESFYTKILNSFVKSWFTLLSHNDDFIHTLKYGLRQATCHLIIKLKSLNIIKLITIKLLPILFKHLQIIKFILLKKNINLDKLPNEYIQMDYTIHPAIINRQTELDYLRAISKCLIPRIFNSDNFHSKIFFSLVRELLACWVLLPLMDCLADPNLINLIIIIATDKNSNNNKQKTINFKLNDTITTIRKVEFLKNFINTTNNNYNKNVDDHNKEINNDKKLSFDCNNKENINILNDRNQLYVFMQYLKKEGAVDELRFYLDVDNLNKELQDPKITTDPAKLSSLHQQSEKLLQDYNKLAKMMTKIPINSTTTTDNIKNNTTTTDCYYPNDVQSLTEAHDIVKSNLEGKWYKAFCKTSEYFKLIYGSREIKILDDIKNIDQSGTVSRLGTKLKDAIRGAIDGSPLDATEIPTVWDALAEPNQIISNTTINNNTTSVYSSVTSKLKKERGQNLDTFLITFMQSIEQSTDIAEEVIENNSNNATAVNNKIKLNKQYPNQPGRNLVFGNLFGLNKLPKNNIQITNNYQTSNIKGPSECLLYILYNLINAPKILVQLIFAFVCISKTTVDSLICYLINKLIKRALYGPRLAVLIQMLEMHLFEMNSTNKTITPTELLERQRLARKRIESLYKDTGYLIDCLQSPALNKHIIYCMLDIVLIELYPEFNYGCEH